MSKSTSTKPADLQQAATTAKRNVTIAEKALKAATEAVASAKAEQADMKARLAGGDATVTSEALSHAATEVERCELLAGAAENELSEARFVLSHATASAVAEKLSTEGSERAKLDQDVAKAAQGVTDALQALVRASRDRQDAIESAKAEAIAAGLQQADPLAPARVVTMAPLRRGYGTSGPRAQRLVVDGQEVEEISVVAATQQALIDALNAVDVTLEVRA